MMRILNRWMGENHTRRGSERLRSSPDSVIFHRKEPELMTKMAVPLERSSYDKCVERHPTYLLFSKPDSHKDFSGYDASWIFKRRQRRRGCTTQLHKNSSSYEEVERDKDNHTTRAWDLSEIIETWPMRMGFLYQASGLFIASRCKRDNYKRELKKGKWRASNAVKAITVSLWKSQTGQWVGMQRHVSKKSGARLQEELNNPAWAHFVLQKKKLSGFLSL
jgi:hypothetical protein